IVVAFEEVIEFRLLLQEVFAGGLGGFELESQMHAFVSAVLLRVAGRDALDLDAEPEPPNRQLGQIESEFGLAKGTPLSVRIALGNPNSLNTASNTGKA